MLLLLILACDAGPAPGEVPRLPDDAPDAPEVALRLDVSPPLPLSRADSPLQHHARAARAPDGRTLVAWTHGYDFAVRAVLVDGEGVASIPVTELAADASKPDVAVIGDGFLVAWQTVGNAIETRAVDAAGAPAGDATRWTGDSDIPTGTAALAVREDGAAAMIWYRGHVAGRDLVDPPEGVYGLQWMTPEQAPLGDALELWPSPIGGGSPPDLVPLRDGRVAAFFQRRLGEPDAEGLADEQLEVAIVDDAGQVDGPYLLVGPDAGRPSRPQASAGARGDVGLVWRTGEPGETRAWFAVLDDARSLGPPLMLAERADRPVVEAMDEGWLVAWEQPRPERGLRTPEDQEVWLGLLDPAGDRWRIEPQLVGEGLVSRWARPAIAAHGDEALVIFEGGSNTWLGVFGVRVRVEVDEP